MVLTLDELNWAPDFDTIFRDHYGRLVRALTVVSGSREAAADAVQEAFVKAHLRWRKVGQYDDPVGWIRRVAINKLRDEHRRIGRKERVLDRLRAEPTTVVAEPELDELGLLLAELPRQQRASIALFYVEGLPIADIADTLGISEGAVKFHLHKGRERLRTLVGEGGGPVNEFDDPDLGRLLGRYAGTTPDSAAAYTGVQRRITRAKRTRAAVWTASGAAAMVVGTVALMAPGGNANRDIQVGDRPGSETTVSVSVTPPVATTMPVTIVTEPTTVTVPPGSTIDSSVREVGTTVAAPVTPGGESGPGTTATSAGPTTTAHSSPATSVSVPRTSVPSGPTTTHESGSDDSDDSGSDDSGSDDSGSNSGSNSGKGSGSGKSGSGTSGGSED